MAIIGRPNVGKSTLLNALVGEERAIVSPVAGTTRDAVDVTVEDGVEYVFVDTAGIRRKGKTHLMAEKLSVVMARRHIRMANVALLVLDATEGVLGADATIAGYAHEEGRAVIICVNKWDAVPNKDREEFELTVRDVAEVPRIRARGVPLGQDRARCEEALPAHSGVLRSRLEARPHRRIEPLRRDPQARARSEDLSTSPRPPYGRPTFVLFTDRPAQLHFSKERFFVNQIRKQFGFEGTPIVLKTKARSGHERKR